jgi:hypothetical protein
MTRASRTAIFSCLCLALAACNSGPSSSGSAAPGEDEAALLGRKADVLGGLIARRQTAAQALDELMSALPDRVWLTEVVYDETGVQVKGRAPTNNLLSDYLSRLERSSSLADTVLRGSAMKTARGREWVEFFLQAAVREPGAAPAPAGAGPAARLDELEKAFAPRQDTAQTLRELQMLALDAGLQMTKFVPGVETAGEFTSELPVTIEVAGGRADLGGYLRGLAGLPRLWLVERLSFKAASGDDPRSEVRASVSARAYFPR